MLHGFMSTRDVKSFSSSLSFEMVPRHEPFSGGAIHHAENACAKKGKKREPMQG